MTIERIIERVSEELFYVAAYIFCGGLIGAVSLSLLLLATRLGWWVFTGEIPHSTHSAHMQASDTIKVLADMWVGFVYGGMFGAPLGLVVRVATIAMTLLKRIWRTILY